jgi:UDP-2,4-diacetamido-2,4,6-trideoxy-beta-L-altropyranose hydrolase
MQRVVIRVDASVDIGLGHLTRCLTLANALAADGTKICFLMRDRSEAFAQLIEFNGHDYRLLHSSGRCGPAADTKAHSRWLPVSWQEDAEDTAREISKLGPVDWLVVDNYALDSGWERELRAKGRRILTVDDLAERPHDCDILLDQNFVRGMWTRYETLVPSTCKSLLGPRYALLRPEFAAQRHSLVARDGTVSRILICFGGTDPMNETTKALAAVRGARTEGLAIDVVVGRGNPNAESVARQCAEIPGATSYQGAENMAALMARADLAVGAGGVMSWERCCLGLPTIAIAIVEHQVDLLEALAEQGSLSYLGAADAVSEIEIGDAIRSLAVDPARIRRMGECARALVDGEGCRRVAAAMSA